VEDKKGRQNVEGNVVKRLDPRTGAEKAKRSTKETGMHLRQKESGGVRGRQVTRQISVPTTAREGSRTQTWKESKHKVRGKKWNHTEG